MERLPQKLIIITKGFWNQSGLTYSSSLSELHFIYPILLALSWLSVMLAPGCYHYCY